MTISERAKDQFVDGGNPGVGKAIVFGAIGGIVVTFAGVGAACLIAGYPWTTAFGLGLFASVWSGLGFGFMFGGIVYVTKLEALEEAERKVARTSARTSTPDDPEPMTRSGSGSTTLA